MKTAPPDSKVSFCFRRNRTTTATTSYGTTRANEDMAALNCMAGGGIAVVFYSDGPGVTLDARLNSNTRVTIPACAVDDDAGRHIIRRIGRYGSVSTSDGYMFLDGTRYATWRYQPHAFEKGGKSPPLTPQRFLFLSRRPRPRAACPCRTFRASRPRSGRTARTAATATSSTASRGRRGTSAPRRISGRVSSSATALPVAL